MEIRLFRCRYQANQHGGNFCIGEIQREHCVFTFHDVGQINFRIVGIQQRQGNAVQQLSGQRDFYLAFGRVSLPETSKQTLSSVLPFAVSPMRSTGSP